jgi:hypothetical protein
MQENLKKKIFFVGFLKTAVYGSADPDQNVMESATLNSAKCLVLDPYSVCLNP